MESKDDDFIKEVRKLKKSINYSIDGLKSCYKGERSLKLHLVVSIIVIIMGILLKIKALDWILTIILFGTLLCIEILNTAIESCVDLITTKKHPLAKRAKDCGSAAAFMMSIFAGIGQLVIFWPYFVNFIK